MILAFTLALFGGTAMIAAWIVTRFPHLAPRSLLVRVVFAAVSVALLQLAPIENSGPFVLYVTVLALSIVLLAVWVSALWMMQSVRDLLA